MSLGVFFALAEKDVQKLRTCVKPQEKRRFLEQLQKRYFSTETSWLGDCDKAWDAMHRALSGGGLDVRPERYPFSHVVLGGEELLCDGFNMILKTPQQVADAAAAIAPLTEEQFRGFYFAINAQKYEQGLSEDDFGYTWEYFVDIRNLFLKAASAQRAVLFTYDE
jgi:hypothetical protein